VGKRKGTSLLLEKRRKPETAQQKTRHVSGPTPSRSGKRIRKGLSADLTTGKSEERGETKRGGAVRRRKEEEGCPRTKIPIRPTATPVAGLTFQKNRFPKQKKDLKKCSRRQEVRGRRSEKIGRIDATFQKSQKKNKEGGTRDMKGGGRTKKPRERKEKDGKATGLGGPGDTRLFSIYMGPRHTERGKKNQSKGREGGIVSC